MDKTIQFNKLDHLLLHQIPIILIKTIFHLIVKHFTTTIELHQIQIQTQIQITFQT